MARMLLSLEGVVIREVVLASEHTTFGRRPYSDVVIDNPAVSGEHALVRLEGADVVLEDLQSTNGTYVNGLPVTRHVLQEGDRVEIGRYQLKFERGPGPLLGAGAASLHSAASLTVPNTDAHPGAHAAASAGAVAALGKVSLAKASPTSPGSAAAEVDLASPLASSAAAPAGAQPLSAGASQPANSANEQDSPDTQIFAETTVPPIEAGKLPKPAVLTVLSGASAGKEVQLIKVVTTLGKSGVGIASITRRIHGFSLVHVEGESQPSLNGNTVGSMPVLLHHGDLVELAGIRMQFAQSPD
jgi:predicted component of type VI protein secretion system